MLRKISALTDKQYSKFGHYHHQVVLARIFLTLALHPFRSFIAFGSSSGRHPASSHSWSMYVRFGRPMLVWPCCGVQSNVSLTSSCLLLQLCPANLVRLSLMVFEIGGILPYNRCFVGCFFQEMFRIARSMQVYVPSSLASSFLVSVHDNEPYTRTVWTAAWKKSRFMSSGSDDFQTSFRPSSAPHALPILVFTSASVDATLLPR